MPGAETAASSGIALHGVDDVQDFVWANEGVEPFPRDRYSHVLDYVENGNRSFRENRFDEAIQNYSMANTFKPNDQVIIGNRCAAYIRSSQYLKHNSLTICEYRSMTRTGLDMRTLAELALKDAERLISLQNDALRSYILKANALILLENYDMAREIIVSGLQLHPSSDILQASLRSLDRRMPPTLMGKRRPELIDDFVCTICMKLLYEPITTPCGHSFCRLCLIRTMVSSNRCSLCQTLLFTSSSTFAVSVSLKNIIQKTFPEEYAKRKSEHDSMINFGDNLIPLYVTEVVIPCQKFSLSITEPRYRLLVRRIMEGNHRIGMVTQGPTTNTVADFACEVEISEYEILPTGSFALQIESRRRFRILKLFEQDGYPIAEVEWVQDTPLRAREDLQEKARGLASYALSWLKPLKEETQDQSKLKKLRNIEVMMPNPQDLELFSFWVATLALLDLAPNSEKLEILRLTDTPERMDRGHLYLSQRIDLGQ